MLKLWNAIDTKLENVGRVFRLHIACAAPLYSPVFCQ